LTDLEWLNENLLLESPVLVQNKLQNFRDIRVTVIGEQIFAVEIETDELLKTDWRKPNISKKYNLHVLPESIRTLIYELHQKLGLIYSAFDFILTPSGEYYFLETNPAGEWVWLERELGLEISNSIINELLCI
jgi:glutathione synthase/RimK-type ligase-like ATP-grasp enzyme